MVIGILKVSSQVKLFLSAALLFASLGLFSVSQAQFENTGIIPTDPSVNRVNWARAEYGSAISGGAVNPSSIPLGFLIDGLGSGTSPHSTLNISAGQSHIIDLGQPREIHTIQIHLWDGDNRFFRYRIDASMDGVNYEPVVDRSTGEHRSVQRLQVDPIVAQYFRITGLHSSSNNSFHLINEVFLIGDEPVTPFAQRNIVVDARDNGGAGVTDGLEVPMNAGVYLVEYVSGASSRWANDSQNGGRTWDTELRVRVPQNFKIYSFGFTHDKLDRFANPAEAQSAREGEYFFIYLPVAAPVYFQYPDTSPGDNRGAQTYRLTQVSGPNDSLLVQVRDAITRSLSWQEREIARWENWLTTSNRNCFGCHTQSWSSVGINDVKAKVTGVPVSRSLELEFVDAYKSWQNSAGWVSPFHGSNYRRTQTSLWAWAVASFRGDSFDELLPNLVNAAQWLRGQQSSNGGWNADHNSGPLYSDGTPSATHTTGNIQAFMRLIDELSEGGDPNNFPPGTTVGQLRDSVRSATDMYSSSGFNFARNVRTNAQTVVGLTAAFSVITPEARSAAVARITDGSQLLRNAQRPDGGWSDATGGGGASTPMQSAQALYALLQVVDQAIDGTVLSGIEYLLTRQREDGSWNAPSGLSQRLVSTTWVEVALPLIFERLRNEFDRDTITDLRAIGLLNGVELSWSPMPEAVGYNIYRRGVDGTFRRIVTNHQDSTVLYFDSDVQIEATYIYMVRWLGSSGIESADSNEASGTPSGLVCGGDSPPIIVSAPVTEGLEGVLYQYQVDAEDPDEGDVLTYSLTVAPQGMTIDPVTGLIEWLPTGNQIGSHFVRVWVEDQIGRFATQAYRLTVSRIFFNEPPVFVSQPVLNAVAGYEYRYAARAVDPNIGDILRYSIESGPDGMWINPTTGLVRWTPGAEVSGSVPVALKVTDAGGLFDEQFFSIEVVANQPPVITSTPVTVAPRGRSYAYQVVAVDPEGATPLEYALLQRPNGMTIQRFTGLILWSPGVEVEGSFPVRVRVTDPGGLFDEQPYIVEVPANDPPYFVSSPVENAEVGLSYQYDAFAEDPEQGEVTYALEQGPAGMSVNSASGRVLWSPTSAQVGPHEVVLRATDDFGLFALQPYTVTVHPAGSGGGGPGGPGGPFAGLNITVHAPEPGSLIESPSEVFASIDTDAGAPDRWEAELRATNSDLRIPIGSGTGAVNSASIGMIDPTMLPNDSYRLYITVEKGTLVGASWFPYDVRSYLKLGEFSLTASDISIPLSGLELSINRRYSTLDRSTGEFGAGWRLQVPGRVVDTASENPLMPFSGATRVFVTRPDGKRVGFTFTPYLLSPLLPFWMPAFTPDPGVTDVLEVDQTVIFASGGQYWELFGPFNPRKYYLTTRERVRYTIDEQLGLLEARDANLNTLTFTQGAIHHSSGESLQLVRDSAGRITRITDPSGRNVSYVYDVNGDLVSVTNQSGETTTYTYWEPNLLRTITLDDGTKILENFYSPDGRLIRQVDGEGNETLIGINVDQRTETIQDARGGITTLRYDENGNLIQRTEPDGAVWSYTYDSNFNQTSETDPLGRVRTWTFDSRSNLLTETDPLGNTTAYTYNSWGQQTSVTNALGVTASKLYDSRGNLVQEIDFSGRTTTYNYDSAGNRLSLTQPSGASTSFAYSASGRISQAVDPLGISTQFLYDANGNLVQQQSARTLPDGALQSVVSQMSFDTLNRPVTIVDREGHSSAVSYNALGLAATATDRRGNSRSFEYDSLGRLTRRVHPDGTFETWDYDEVGNLLSSTDRLGRLSLYEYDAASRLVKYTYPDGSFSTTTYDALGQVVAETDTRGFTRTYAYDPAGRKITETDPLGAVTQFAYDEVGNLVSETDALGRVTSYSYDPDGRLTTTVFPDGSTQTLEYDADGRETRRTDELGRTTEWSYDLMGRLLSVTDASGGSVQYLYDELGNKRRSIDQLGRVTKYHHDREGRLISTTLPLGQVESFAYDQNGNRISHATFSGETLLFDYDADNRLILKTYPDSSAETVTWLADGNRASVSDARGNTSYTYNERGWLTEVDSPEGSLGYGYDSEGNRLSVQTPSGLTQYSYDPLGRLINVADAETGNVSYEYDALSNLVRTSHPNGLVETREYDLRDRLVRLRTRDGAETEVLGFDYTLDAVGNRLSITELSGRVSSYSYDILDRVTEESINDHGALSVISYEYDAAGNRVLEVRDGTPAAYVYDDNDRLLSADGLLFDYDSRGNTIQRGDEFFVWDLNDRLVEYSAPGVTASYSYDSDGIKVAATVNGTVSRKLVDHTLPFAQVVEERDAANELLARYAYGNARLARVSGGQATHYHHDGLGSTRGLSTSAGLLSDAYTYRAFGEVYERLGTTENPYQFTGERFAPESSSYYLRSRWMSPGQGRFFSRDTYQFADNYIRERNKYVYAANSPVLWADPSGQNLTNYVILIRNNAVIAGSAAGGVGRVVYFVHQYAGARLSFASTRFFGMGVAPLRGRYGAQRAYQSTLRGGTEGAKYTFEKMTGHAAVFNKPLPVVGEPGVTAMLRANSSGGLPTIDVRIFEAGVRVAKKLEKIRFAPL